MKKFIWKDFFGKTRSMTKVAVSKDSIEKIKAEIIRTNSVKEDEGIFVPKIKVVRSPISNRITKKITHT